MADYLQVEIPDGLQSILTKRAEAEGYSSASEFLAAFAISVAENQFPSLAKDELSEIETRVLTRRQEPDRLVEMDKKWVDRTIERVRLRAEELRKQQ